MRRQRGKQLEKRMGLEAGLGGTLTFTVLIQVWSEATRRLRKAGWRSPTMKSIQGHSI